jgi:anti-sigma B factor antagonist
MASCQVSNKGDMTMPQANVTMNVRKAGNIAGIIDIQGEVTAFAEKVLNEAYAQASANGVRAVLLNFSGLEYMNSSGIGLLVTTLIRANRQSQKLMVFGLSEHYRHIFELTRLNEAIGVYGNEAEALAAARAA